MAVPGFPSGGNTPGWVDGLSTTEPELETITVYNDMSWESCWRIIVKLGEKLGIDVGDAPMGGSLERIELRFFGTVHQTWRWQENVLGN